MMRTSRTVRFLQHSHFLPLGISTFWLRNMKLAYPMAHILHYDSLKRWDQWSVGAALLTDHKYKVSNTPTFIGSVHYIVNKALQLISIVRQKRLGAVHKWRHRKGGGGVSAKGDVIYEQKYGGPNQPYDVNHMAIKKLTSIFRGCP